MKKLLLTLLPILALSFASTAQDTLFVEEFDGGIPDTWEISEGNPLGGVWQWSATASADSVTFMGERYAATFYGNIGQMDSQTPNNGAAMFNSDALDSGEGAAPGTGPLLAPHEGSLTSPSIDCSTLDTVYLKFNQSYREFQASSILEVSNDGGMNWDTYDINTTIDVNDWTGPSSVVLVNISETAANASDVRIRWTFSGDYYFWLVDDVQVLGAVEQELIIGDIFFSPPSYGKPGSQTENDTLFFDADVSNLGALPVEELVLLARILKAEGGDFEEVYRDSVIVNFPAEFRDSTISIPDGYPMGNLDLGEYRLVYDVFSNDRDDFNPNNNQAVEAFVVTGDTYTKEDGAEFITRIDNENPFKVGNLYTTGPAPEPQFKVAEVEFAGGKDVEEDLPGTTLLITLEEVSEFVPADYTGFTNDSLEAVGFQQYDFPDGTANEELQTTDLLSLDIDQTEVALKPNTRYFLLVNIEDGLYQHAFNNNIDYFQVSTVVFQDEWSLGGFGPDLSAVLRMRIDMTTNEDNIPLPEGSMTVFPNPVKADGNLSVDVNLEREEEAMLVIFGLNGQVLQMKQYDKLKDEVVSLPVNNLAAGTYFVRLSTNTGTKTKKFVVVR